ncbi:DUF4396 domain-containing protein [Terrabacter sp. Root85]|uniref:DUF4396 domain-containing protein n=1 Tax=Terrabacter sp. Root85 TaxID=1736603 RepID=UPI000AA52E48|nr:DUF4396 domain-containing protein [Terrabacter sp. Root85]
MNEAATSAHEHHDAHEHPGAQDATAGPGGGLASMAAGATLHCLTGCAVGEILGLMIGTAVGLAAGATIALSVALAFFFGYALSSLPLLRSGLSLRAALALVLAADTVSILTMEVVDNLVMAVIPGAMDAGLVNAVFWVGMSISLVAAFAAAYPVNRQLLSRGKGHALTHAHHGASGAVTGWRRFIPDLPAPALAAAIAAFMLGGLVVAVADGLA